jgi:hypothetical protein
MKIGNKEVSMVQPYGEDNTRGRRQGGGESVNEFEAIEAGRARLEAYFEKIREAERNGIYNILDQLSYSEYQDYGSLLVRYY